MKDDHLLETKLAEGSRAEAACAGSGQMIHQMCSRDLAMLQVKGQTRSQEDIRVSTQLAPVAICTVRQRKAMGFPTCKSFLGRCFASLLNNWFHSKILLFLNNIRHHQEDYFINLLYILCLTTHISNTSECDSEMAKLQ